MKRHPKRQDTPRYKIPGQFAWRTIAMLRSPPYRLLSLSARRCLDRIEIELARHGGQDNGKLPVTFANFEEYGVRRHSIAAALRELEAVGFIEMTPGRSGNGEFRQANLFRLTYRPSSHGKPTDEWRAIATTEEAKRKLENRPPIRTPASPPETSPKTATRHPTERHRKGHSPPPETSPLSRTPLGREQRSVNGSSDELPPHADQLSDEQRPADGDGSPGKVLH
jgi:DNA-binding transcriptional MocR family regulator